MANTYTVAQFTGKGQQWFAEGFDHLGIDWTDKIDRARAFTQAEIYHIVTVIATPSMRLRIYETGNPIAQVAEETVTGYAGQDDNDEATYDAARSWKEAA